MDQLDLIDTSRAFHPKTILSTFSQVHTEHSPGLIISWFIILVLVNFLKIEIISSIFSDHKVVRLDVNDRGKKLLKTQTCGG